MNRTVKTTSATVFLTLIYILSNAQNILISNCEQYKYSIGHDSIPHNWNTLTYNDDNWLDGYKHIGYGDEDDTTVISPSTSVFLRIPFEITSLDSVKETVLGIDFDDAVVAYLNGQEILRVNLEPSLSSVPFDALATKSHEASSAQWRSDSYTYFIDSTLSSNLKLGKNILAFQVHNDSLNGSDLSFNADYFTRSYTEFDPYSPVWRALKQKNLDSTKLPIIIINTQTELGNYGVRQPIQLNIIHTPNSYNKPSDYPNVYNEFATYEIRGQSSSNWAKKSFNIELKDGLWGTQNKNLLDLGPDNDWVLAANYTDRSCLRNRLTYDLASSTNTIAPDSRFVELIIDGEYRGLYQFMEKPKRGKQRIDIEKQEPFQTEDIAGGYIFKFDKREITPKEMVVMEYRDGKLYTTYPDKRYLSDEQKEYISEYWDNLFKYFDNEIIPSPETGYRDIIDVESFIDFTIINEITKNSDGFRYSTFMYKPKDEPLHFGPLWDFDLSFGNSTAQNGNNYKGWLHKQGTNKHSYQTQIFKDSVILVQFKKRYTELRQTTMSDESIIFLIDSISDHINEARIRNYEIWPHNNYAMQSWVGTPAKSIDAESDITYLKSWIKNRTAWLDENIQTLEYTPLSPSTTTATEKHETSYMISISNNFVTVNSDIHIHTLSLTNISSLAINSRSNSNSIDISKAPNGIYFLEILLENGDVKHETLYLD